MSTREFEFKDGASDKFWKIALDGQSTTVNFGRRGTGGQTQTKEWGSEAEARKNYDKLIAEKTKKGYVEMTSGATTAPVAVARTPLPVARTPVPVARTPLPDPLPAARGEGTGAAARGEGTGAAGSDLPLPLAGEGRGEGKPLSGDVGVNGTPRTVDLSPAEWALATWREPAPPVERPAAAPFDLQACAAKLQRLRFKGYGWDADWSQVALPEVMSREEAHYWFLAATSLSQNADTAALAAELAKLKIDGRVTAEDVRAAYATKSARFIGAEIVLALKHLLSLDDIGGLLLDDTIHGARHGFNTGFLEGFRRWLVPGLAKADADKLRARVRPLIAPAAWPADLYVVPAPFLVAAALGMSEELRAVVDGWRDDQYRKDDWNDHYHQPQMVIFGLGDPALVEQQMRRRQLRLKTPRHVAGWLAHTEWRALDYAADSIAAVANKDECEALVMALHAVKAPEAAGPMLKLVLQSKAPKAARAWLEANVGHTIAGLAAVTAGRGALADAAVEELRALKRKGLGSQIAEAVKALPAEQRGRAQAEVVDHQELALEAFDEKTTPAWLAEGVAAAVSKKAPAWVAAGDLPPLVAGGRRLTDKQIAAVFAALQASTLDQPHALVAGLREHADPAGADAFAWKLFERWLGEGAPSKEKWAMAAVGALGGDTSVLKLTPMVRAWPGESQHQRAVLGLEVLRAIGTDTALMQLNGIAQKLKFAGLKAKAQEYMEAIAKDKGLTRAELEDRVVPDCDLDERGHRVFDFGPRQFHFVLGPEMKPMVRDGDGERKLRDNLPAAGAKDDAAKAEEAIAGWKLMKKQIKEIAKLQADRLEQAMVTGRRWATGDFQTLILRHPLMTHLARLLLWGVYDGTRLRDAFRVTEDQECANADDDPYPLPADGKVGLVHPLQLEDAAREAWGQRFTEYAIIPPFPQLGRAIHGLEKGEAEKASLGRFDKLKLPAPTLVYTLEKQGWLRGTAMDAGCFDEHSRQFPAAAITAVFSYEGTVGMGYIQPEEELTVTGCCFIKGLRAPSGYGDGLKDKLALGAVDPIVLSETLHDLTILAAKAKSA
jgi:predicted DNA-binding WGR domain protein